MELEYYSQHGEDYLLHWLFESVESGFYVDIGAFDGRHLSNTYVFEQLGWSGICVEPHPEYFPFLKRNRPNATCVGAAIVPAPTPSVAFMKERLGLLSGVAADRTPGLEARYARRNMTFEGFETVEVPALTPDMLMENHAPGRKRFEILSIDTEGTDLEVLRAFDFARYQPSAVVIEANDEADREPIISLMSERRYHFARRLNCNLIFCQFPDNAIFARYKRINCRMADTLHPLGEAATLPGCRARVIQETETEQEIAPNVFQQEPGQPLSSLLEWFPEQENRARIPRRLVHAVNLSPATSAEQTMTTHSMAEAAKRYEGNVTLLNVQHPADPDLTPDGFVRRDLTRDVRDVGSFNPPRALPLLFDILDRAVEGLEPDDYLVFTSSDICPHEYFYACIQELLGSGFDAITVTRRTIGRINAFPAHSQLPLAETGFQHPGSDCFVFRRGMYDRFAKNLACVGIALVGGALLYNMVAHSKRMLLLSNVSLTYHFGNDRPWFRDDTREHTHHNSQETLAVVNSLCQNPGARERLTAFCENRPEPAVIRNHLRTMPEHD
jgi:FkbM family methyltransferase